MEVIIEVAENGDSFTLAVNEDETVSSLKERITGRIAPSPEPSNGNTTSPRLQPQVVRVVIQNQSCEDGSQKLSSIGITGGDHVTVSIADGMAVGNFPFGSGSRPLTEVLLAPNSAKLYALGGDNVAEVWDTQTGRSDKILRWIPNPKCFLLSPTGQTLYMMSHVKDTVEVRDTTSWKMWLIFLPEILRLEEDLNMVLSTAGHTLYVIGALQICVIDVTAIGREQPSIQLIPQPRCGDLTALLATEEHVYSLYDTQLLTRNTVQGFEEISSANIGVVNQMLISPCNAFLYTLGPYMQVTVWDTETLLLTGIFDCERLPYMKHAYAMSLKSFALSQCGARVYCAGWGVSVWDAHSYDCLGMLRLNVFVRSIAVGAGSSTVSNGGEGKRNGEDLAPDSVVFVASTTPDEGRPGEVMLGCGSLTSVPLSDFKEDTGTISHNSFVFTGSSLAGRTDKFHTRRVRHKS